MTLNTQVRNMIILKQTTLIAPMTHETSHCTVSQQYFVLGVPKPGLETNYLFCQSLRNKWWGSNLQNLFWLYGHP